MTKKLLTFIFITVFYSSNVFSQNFTNVKSGTCITMDIPNYLTKTYDLNDVAILQYKNIIKESYVIAISDSKEELNSLGMHFENSKDFLEYFVKDYFIEAKKRNVSKITEFESNNNNHAQVEMTWEDEDGEFYMLITGVETKNNFYKILCWTIIENKDILKNDYLIISKSLKD